MKNNIVTSEFYVIRYGVRTFKYLGGNQKYKKTDDINLAETYYSKELAENYLNIFKKGTIVKVKATFEIGIDEESEE